MASSTTIPITSDSPSNVKVLRVKLSMCKKINVPKIEVGMAKMTFNAELNDPKNNQHTIEVRMADNTSVVFNS